MILWIERCHGWAILTGARSGHHLTVCRRDSGGGSRSRTHIYAPKSMEHRDVEHDWQHRWFDLPKGGELFTWDEEG